MPKDMSLEEELDRELGRELARIRERAAMTQAELAKQLKVSQTVVSRTESGDRHLEDGELRGFAHALGSDEAGAIERRRRRSWRELPRPPLGHPDHDLLFGAEKVARELASHLRCPHTAQAFARRIEGLLAEIQAAADLLLKRACNIVFIGEIGVGKTSAICRITGLVVPRPRGRSDLAVLDVGAGRVTLCEVQVTTGPTGMAVEPSSDADIRAYVAEFIDKVIHGLGEDGKPSGVDQEERGLSSEVEKAIRNMAGLARPGGAKGPDGNRLPDPAKVLAREILDDESARGRGAEDAKQRLQFEVHARMRTDRRKRLDLRFDEDSGTDPLAWLKSEFHRINTCTNPEFTIPKRIRVSVDKALIPGVAAVDGVEVRIVDTKGIDETVARADLEDHFGSSHTVIVLCSGFNDAPGKHPVALLNRATEAGIDAAGLHGIFLGLPKFDEALQMRDDAGEYAETVEEGYDMKAELVEEVVHTQLGFGDFSVQFFNSHEDEAEGIRAQVGARVQAMFDGYRQTTRQLVEDARTLLANFEDEQTQEIVRQAMLMVRNWVATNGHLRPAGSIEGSLMRQVEVAHPSTLHATTRRRGGWYNLDFSHHLSYGARLVVSAMLREKMKSFEEHCRTFLAAPENEPARPLLDQAQRAMARTHKKLAKRAQLHGEMWFHDEMEPDDPHWKKGVERWGKGEGYMLDVIRFNRHWFSEKPRANERLAAMAERKWQEALADIENMLDLE